MFEANDNPLINDSSHLDTLMRTHDDTEEQPRIKKPLNAFMLFRAEQSQNVADELRITNSTKVNVELGQRWKMMSDEEQAPYFEQARREKRDHEAKYSSQRFNKTQFKAPKALKIPVLPERTCNRQDLHTYAAPPTSATVNAASRRRKCDDTEEKPYIKKPLNAFMLFRAEQSQNVADELRITNAIQVNTELGQRWKKMSEQEQAPYFEQARRERRAHEAKYPGWSPKDNFGRKAKRWNVDQIPVPPNHHSCHACHSQKYQKPFQKLFVETSIMNGIPVVIMPLEAFLNQAHENQVPIEVLPTETFSTPVSPFQDLSNQALDDLAPDDLAPNKQAAIQELPVETVTINGIPIQCNPYEVFLNMAPEDQADIQRLLD